jgi:hypothetical protein
MSSHPSYEGQILPKIQRIEVCVCVTSVCIFLSKNGVAGTVKLSMGKKKHGLIELA